MKLGPRQTQWVEDIPLYEQAKGMLCDGKGFCCLGVYAHTQINEPWDITDINEWCYSDGITRTSTNLFENDWKRLRLRSGIGQFKSIIFWKGKQYETLIDLNDSFEITPEEMAQFIQGNADNIFTRAA